MRFEDPKVLSDNFRKTLKGGSKVINLHDWSPFYYQFGIRCARIIGSRDIPLCLEKVRGPSVSERL